MTPPPDPDEVRRRQRGRAVAIGESPDDMILAARNRLYVSRDGGRFWRSLAPELPDVEAVAWATGS